MQNWNTSLSQKSWNPYNAEGHMSQSKSAICVHRIFSIIFREWSQWAVAKLNQAQAPALLAG